MKELTDEEKKNMLEWSEGNKYLYDLLYACFENGIRTFASCGGHEKGNDSPYLGIIINEKSMPFIRSMMGQIQGMDNIDVQCGVRGTCDARGNEQLLPDEELRQVTFHAHNYNCCELFYRMRKGIETMGKEKKLSPKANRFFEHVKRLNETSREELEAAVNDKMIVGSTFFTQTQEFEDFKDGKKMIRNSKIGRFFRRLLPFRKTDTSRYDELQRKYGFLQREYEEENTEGDENPWRVNPEDLGHMPEAHEQDAKPKRYVIVEDNER